jgi:hypothetical protein
MAHRPVRRADQPARRYAVAPTRVLPDGDDVPPALLGAGRVDERRLVRLSHRRQVAAGRRHLQHARDHARCRPERLARQVQERDLADNGRDVPVRGRGSQGVPAAHRRPEGRHAGRIDAGQRAGERDRCAPVLELAGGLEPVGLATAVAESAVVEEERGDPGGREALREGAEPIAPRPRQPVGHHDHRGAGRSGIPPGGARFAAREEGEVFSVHAQTTRGTGAP